MSQQSQQQQQPETEDQKRIRIATKRLESIVPENVIILLAGDERSNPKLREVIKAEFPKAAVLERVAIQRLVNVNAVIACVPQYTEEFDEETGYQKPPKWKRPRFTVPVFVADHWRQNAGGDFSVNLATFCSELAPMILPYQLNSRAIGEGFIHVKDV